LKGYKMKKINRRKFIKTIPQVAAGIALGANSPKLFESGTYQDVTLNGITAVIPMPIQVVIDDVGWWCGKDGSTQQEPYRTGIKRDHHPADYTAFVELGRALKIRPQTAFILCEWDKYNILRKLPTSTWMGENWDNSKWVGPWQEEAADIIRKNSKYFEFTLHGIGHEYWVDNKFTRAEWAERNGTMRPLDQVEKHLDFYAMIMDQHKLGPFPVAFVPTAFYHGFGPTPGHDISMAEVLKKRGITYINTPFQDMHNATAVDHGVFGFDSGVMTINRGRDLLGWQSTGQAPKGTLRGPTCGMHWANIIHPDPARNLEVVNEWIKLLAPYNEKQETILAPNSIYFQNQLAHQVCTKVKVIEKNIELDFKEVDALPGTLSKNELTLKVKGQNAMKFKSNEIKIVSQKSIKTEGSLLYTLMLERKKGRDKAQLTFSATS
jgi:hypothetical protein